jgi:hypothetical protein
MMIFKCGRHLFLRRFLETGLAITAVACLMAMYGLDTELGRDFVYKSIINKDSSLLFHTPLMFVFSIGFAVYRIYPSHSKTRLEIKKALDSVGGDYVKAEPQITPIRKQELTSAVDALVSLYPLTCSVLGMSLAFIMKANDLGLEASTLHSLLINLYITLAYAVGSLAMVLLFRYGGKFKVEDSSDDIVRLNEAKYSSIKTRHFINVGVGVAVFIMGVSIRLWDFLGNYWISA